MTDLSVPHLPFAMQHHPWCTPVKKHGAPSSRPPNGTRRRRNLRKPQIPYLLLLPFRPVLTHPVHALMCPAHMMLLQSRRTKVSKTGRLQHQVRVRAPLPRVPDSVHHPLVIRVGLATLLECAVRPLHQLPQWFIGMLTWNMFKPFRMTSLTHLS